MDIPQILNLVLLASVTLTIVILFVLRPDINKRAQQELNAYLAQNLSTDEIGRFYERYIGHKYETAGYDVAYHGALNGYEDMGRDLIVTAVDETLIIQTKCWSKSKSIPVKYIFELYGTSSHYHKTAKRKNRLTKPVLYTTAQYSESVRRIAWELGVQLKTVPLDRSYPMIKCKISEDGTMSYYLPFDSEYDKIKMDLHRDDRFAKTVQEAVEYGFRRAA